MKVSIISFTFKMCWWIYNNRCIEQHQRWEVNADFFSSISTYCTCFWQPFYYNTLHFNPHIYIFHTVHFTTEALLLCIWGELSIIFILTNITRLISANQCGSGAADVARLSADREGDSSWGEKACFICRDPAAVCTHTLIYQRFSNPKCRHFTWMRLDIFLVCLQTAQTVPTDSTFRFNSVWITLIWGEVQLDLHRRDGRN